MTIDQVADYTQLPKFTLYKMRGWKGAAHARPGLVSIFDTVRATWTHGSGRRWTTGQTKAGELAIVDHERATVGVCPGPTFGECAWSRFAQTVSREYSGSGKIENRPIMSVSAGRSSPVWTRTKNLPVNSRLLCQLSYGGPWLDKSTGRRGGSCYRVWGCFRPVRRG
jgi:hypothetical protein